MKAIEEADELFTTGRMHRKFEGSFHGFSAAVCEVCSRRRLNGDNRVELLCELRHVTVVIIGAAHVNQLFCLLLDGANYFRMAVTSRADADAGVAIQEQVAVHVFNPDAAGPFRNEFKGRPRVGWVNKLCIRFDDLLAVWAWQLRLYLGALEWCDYGGRHVYSLVKEAKIRPVRRNQCWINALEMTRKLV